MSTRMRTVAVIALIFAALAATQLAMGRSAICPCGQIALWSGNIQSNQNSQMFADPYSLTHIEHGLLLFWALRLLWPRGSLDLRLVAGVVVEALWEGIENSPLVIDRYRETTISLGYYGDSVLNSAGDVAFCIAGFLLASRIRGRTAAAVVLGLEAILLVTIRDNLLLNIVMLLWPIAAILNWQAAA